MTAYLAQSAGMRLDSIYMDSLAQVNKIKVARGAAAAMRAAGENPDAARKSKKALVNFKGGDSRLVSSCAGCRPCRRSTSRS